MPGRRICIVTPNPRRSRTGNALTALRWARYFRELGYPTVVREAWDGERCDILVAMHARRSAASVARFRAVHADRPIVVVLTGTDLYEDLPHDPAARRSLALADRLVLHQPEGLRRLPAAAQRKAVAILHGAHPPAHRPRRRPGRFDVVVLANLRPVKDPLRTAFAARELPVASRIRVQHAGVPLDRGLARAAQAEAARNPRYGWLGELSPAAARRLLSRASLCVLSSRAEGGANVVAEALVSGVPVLATRIPGTIGQLGRGYPGYFRVGDTVGLRRLLLRSEVDRAFYARLTAACRRLAPRFRPAAERKAWGKLLAGLAAR